jgi:hypothetical protein
MLAEGEHPRLLAMHHGDPASRGCPPAAGMTVFIWPIPHPVMLAEGEHPRLWRRTMVIQ